MTQDPDKRRRMREAAEACSGACWEVVDYGDCTGVAVRGSDGESVAVARDMTSADAFGLYPHHGQHIAEADPASVLALLDALEQAERERDEARRRVEELEQEVQDWHHEAMWRG